MLIKVGNQVFNTAETPVVLVFPPSEGKRMAENLRNGNYSFNLIPHGMDPSVGTEMAKKASDVTGKRWTYRAAESGEGVDLFFDNRKVGHTDDVHQATTLTKAANVLKVVL